MQQATVICPHCLEGNEPLQPFCGKCGTPLTSFAEIDPLGRIRAMGDTYRKAIACPDKLTVLIGMWLLFGPSGAGALYWVITTAIGRIAGNPEFQGVPGTAAFFVYFIWYTGVIAINSMILFRVTRNYRRRRSLLAAT